MKSPVAVVQGNLCDMIGTGQLDILISNPPYLTDAEYDSLTDSVKAWEPAEALRSGIDGLETTRRLLVEGLRVMKPGGWIILEVDCSRATRVATAAAQVGWSEVLVKDDLFGRARYLVARRSGF
jgi:release factor glutamine methyltransferase